MAEEPETAGQPYDSGDKIVHYVSLVSGYRITEADKYQRQMTLHERREAAEVLDILGMRLRGGDR